MRANQLLECETFPCPDVRHEGYIIPGVEIEAAKISIVMIAEAAPPNPADYFYAPGDPLFQQTTVQAFNDAGVKASTIAELVGLGVYFTTAVKCGKTGYGIQAGTIKECSFILEKELALFPNIQVYLLMGDVAIKALNTIAARAGEKRVIPAGSTYKIRGQPYYFRDKRAFPSYLQAGPSFFIEKSKRKVIAEDIAAALDLVK
jgi:uracil-DNA glycosylase